MAARNRKIVNLDRVFVSYEGKDDQAIDRISLFDSYYGSLSWAKLLEAKRSVILAEAGSGKSTEFKARRDKLEAEGDFAFYATVQTVATEGLEKALGPKQRAKYEAWLKSSKPGYFFIDSVDEAKLDNIRFDTAMRQLADGIEDGRARAVVCISSRVTDWEKFRDLETLKDLLAVPGDVAVAEAKSAEDVLKDILDNNFKKPTVKENKPLVVLMTGLNKDRVKIYAAAQNVEALDDFMASIESSNLWSLARRPADLDWLISYWQKFKKFAPYAVMLEDAIKERLKEPDREVGDEISLDVAKTALERIGAALVFGRRDKIKIQDAENLDIEPDEADLKAILPDWSADHVVRLRGRAVFDLATFGTVRLHGDNDGSVRAFLAAKWIQKRLKQPGFSMRDARDLLFTDTYGVPLVKPSVQETAAWLSIWDADIAAEVVKRNPFILLTGGDPASLSAAVRADALRESVRRMVQTGERIGWDRDGLKRFSTPDILPRIKSLWAKYPDDRNVRSLLSQMLSLGKLSGADEIIESAVFAAKSDPVTATFGGRALLSVSDTKVRKRYAKHTISKAKKLPETAVWEALDGMFLQEIGIEDFFKVVDALKVSEDSSGYNFQEYVPRIVAKAVSKADIEALLKGLMKRLGKDAEGYDEIDKPRDKGLISAIAQVSGKLIALTSQNEVPIDAAIAAFVIRQKERYTRREHYDFTDALRANPARRRKMLYAAREYFKNSPILQGRPLNTVSNLDFLGWPTGLKAEDLDWLLTDFQAATSDADKLFFMTGALGVWRDEGKAAPLLAKIKAVGTDERTKAIIKEWVSPPKEIYDTATKKQLEKSRRKAKANKATRDQSWVDFLKPLKENPAILRDFTPKKPDDVNGRLYYLWKLLNACDNHNSQFAIESVDSLRGVLGDDLADEFQSVLVTYWRTRKPTLRSERDANSLNQVSEFDCMGIASISLEAKADAGWANKLSSEEATKAAQYATVELNRFPFWFSDLIKAHPKEVSAVLLTEFNSELSRPDTPRFRTLQDINYSPPDVAEAVAPDLYSELQKMTTPADDLLASILTALTTGLPGDLRAQFGRFCLARAKASTEPGAAGLYLSAAFAIDANAASGALAEILAQNTPAYQKAMAERLLPNLFGDGMMRRQVTRPELPLNVLATLVSVAFNTIRIDEDNERPSGEVYSPNERDNAERARGYAFNALVEVPGFPTYAKLQEWAKSGEIDLPPQRFKELALQRALQDSEHSPWPLEEAHALEKEFDVAPVTPDDLQNCALRRIDDLQHDLLNTDFAQGPTLKRMPNETEVQIWTAAQLKAVERRAYSVERESEVVNGKAPDIRLRSKVSDASMPIEIKVADEWTLQKLNEALNVQLVGRYLRDKDAKRGILLLIHQNTRKWITSKGKALTFSQVVARLEAQAKKTAAGTDAPQARIAVLDVSSIPGDKKPAKAKSATKRVVKKALRKKTKTNNRRSTKSKRR